MGCFGEGPHRLDLSPETFIVGPNNVGKSTFIAAYWFMRYQNFSYPFTKFRNYNEAVFKGKTGPRISITIRGTYDGTPVERTLQLDRNNQPSITSQVGTNESFAMLSNTLNETWYLSSDRVFIPTEQGIGGAQTIIDFRAGNVVPFLLERWTSRDPRWDEAEEWLRRIDPSMTVLKSPLRGNVASIETSRKYGTDEVDVNVSFQGGGIQRALQLVSALVFSPKGSMIILEEPEMNLHKETQETLVDLINTVVDESNKQVVVTTHSWDMILPFISDLNDGRPRGEKHIKAKRQNFKLVFFDFEDSDIKIKDYDLSTKKYTDITKDFNLMWGGYEKE